MSFRGTFCATASHVKGNASLAFLRSDASILSMPCIRMQILCAMLKSEKCSKLHRTRIPPHAAEHHIIIVQMPVCMHMLSPSYYSNFSIIASLTFLFTTPPTPKAGTILHMRAKLLVSQSALTLAKRCLSVVSPFRL